MKNEQIFAEIGLENLYLSIYLTFGQIFQRGYLILARTMYLQVKILDSDILHAVFNLTSFTSLQITAYMVLTIFGSLAAITVVTVAAVSASSDRNFCMHNYHQYTYSTNCLSSRVSSTSTVIILLSLPLSLLCVRR